MTLHTFPKHLPSIIICVVTTGLLSTIHAQTPTSNATFTELELISISQLEEGYQQRFDLSGMVLIQDRTYAVSDKKWDRFIYEIGFRDKEWYISDTIPLKLGDLELDLEGIDACNERFLLINEANNRVYSTDRDGVVKEIPTDLSAIGENPAHWKKNAGLEGLAVDCDHQILYLAKERQPRFIVKVDLKNGDISDKFSIPEIESNDFADMKFENGYLYALERNGNFIAKIDPQSHKVINKVSYKNTNSPPEGKLYSPSPYGMAEAILLTPEEIWIGIDNNHLNVSKHACRKYHITGKHPVILRFKRPKGF